MLRVYIQYINHKFYSQKKDQISKVANARAAGIN